MLNGGDGNDSLVGAAGNDCYVLDSTLDAVVESAGSDVDSVLANVSGYTLADNVEYLELIGAAIQGTGNALHNTLRGNASANSLDGGAGQDTVFGGNGADTLIGGAEADSLIGGADDDFYLINSPYTKIVESSTEGIDSVTANVSGYLLSSHVEWLILNTGVVEGSGGSTANTLVGNLVANSLSGGAGSDSLYADAGDDTLNGGVDDDTMVGGVGNDYYFVDSLADDVLETFGGGTDRVYVAIENYALDENLEHLELGTDIIVGGGNSGDNSLLGNSIGNSISGNDGNDTILGLGGRDTLDGGTGNDSLIGGEGNDLYLIDSVFDVVFENAAAGIDSITAAVDGYILSAYVEYLQLADDIYSGSGNDFANILIGNAVANSLFGGMGADTFIGGDGNDEYILDNFSDVVIELANEGSQDLVRTSASGQTLFANVEAMELIGNAISGFGNSISNTLTANNLLGSTLDGAEGDDTLIGGFGDDYFVIDGSGDSVEGGMGMDSVLANSDNYTLGGGAEWLIFGATTTIAFGNTLSNTLLGNASANTLNGGSGADSMVGGNGNDYYFVDHLSDVVIEAASGGSSDTINLDVSGYIVPENIENIVTSNNVTSVTGNSAGNALVGNALDNTLDGGLGADTLTGGDGNDYFVVDNLGDQIIESSGAASGIDSVKANVLLYSLSANMEVLTMGNKGVTGYGNSLANTLIGNSTYNLLYGGGGDDYLTGGGGSDVFNGGMGIDTMVGGSGSDRFVVDNLGDSLVGGGGADSIVAEINSSIYTLPSNFNILILGDSYTAGIVYGNSGNNTITGNSLANTLNGNGGSDYLAGELGNDYYLVDSSGDIVVEDLAEGTDTIEFLIAGSSYTLGNNFERLILGADAVNGVGNSLRNTLVGNTGDNSLSAAAGNDSLFGDSGNDTLLGCIAASSGGRAEIDTLTGGGDSDIFILGTTAGYFYDDGNAGNLGATDYAYIMDFVAGVDKLQLRGTSANYYLGNHTVSSLMEHQGLYRELGATDELIAIIQGSPISALDNTTVNWV
jgi:Ca2+-binding RTX toxin-like protein